MKYELTQRQKSFFNFIKTYFNEHKKMPSTMEMQKHMKVKSANSIFMFLNQLQKRGYITKQKGMRSSVAIVDDIVEENLKLQGVKSAAINFVNCHQALKLDPKNKNYHAPRVHEAFKTLRDLL